MAWLMCFRAMCGSIETAEKTRIDSDWIYLNGMPGSGSEQEGKDIPLNTQIEMSQTSVIY